MRTEIYYGNNPVFSGLCPTPLVSRKDDFVRYGKRWATVEGLSLEGMLTGCFSFAEMLQRQSQLLSGFSKNFQELRVEEAGQVVYSQDVVFVKGISFPESNYSYMLPFSIELQGYPSGFFSGFYGVLDPQNVFSFSQQGDDIVSISHTVSAKGFNTSSSQTDALQNAINFCESYSGLNGLVAPNFISSGNISNSVLKTISQNVDRLNATCSISETWDYDPILGGEGLLRYVSSFNSGAEEGVVKTDLAGSLVGGHNVDLGTLRTRMAALNFYEMASGHYSQLFNGTLNSKELSVNIEENPLSNAIDFTYSFDDDPRPNPYFDDSFSMNLNEINAEKTASIEVAFKWRGNCRCNNEAGWNELKSYADSFNYFQLASERNEYYNSGTFLKVNPISSGVSQDKNQCQLTVSVEFENLDLALIPPHPLHSFDYSIQVKPALPQYSAKPTICKGHYSIFNLNYNNRATYTINGNSLVQKCESLASGEVVTKCMIEQIASRFVSGQDIVLTSQSFDKNVGEDNRGFSFSYSWTAKVDPIFPSGVLYV
jgi:hypothetical protein